MIALAPGTGLIDTEREFHDLSASLYLPLAVGVAVVVVGVVSFVVVRGRRGDDSLPAQRSGAPRLEATYALLLTAVAAFLITSTFRVDSRVAKVSARPGLEVRVTAAKWRWRFDYRGLGVSEVGTDRRSPTLVVPTDTTVRFELTSLDVVHSFWIPSRRFKRDAFPKRTTRFDLVFDRAGFTDGTCAEFCGLRHTTMRFNVNALTPTDFRRWAGRRRREAVR